MKFGCVILKLCNRNTISYFLVNTKDPSENIMKVGSLNRISELDTAQ